MGTAGIGIMGKHPEYGDFLQTGIPEPVLGVFNGWLDACLPVLRDQMGQGWGPFWDGAQDLRFWIGRSVLGQTVVGILRPSRDRVGRRFPLILLASGADVPVPLGAGVDQAPWDRMAAHLDRMQAGKGAAALLEGLDIEIAAEGENHAAIGPTLWAHHPEGNLDALLASAAGPDVERAQLMRSYWWATGTRDAQVNRAATWLGCAGLPEPQALGWLLGGVAGEAEAGA
ncbi:type VI secretion system-associated protein TagF [Sulfitobacter geojensis]|uniref:type VI secretion system-associated protein TagF n=1 Tax=Sulfitobacter geojensis TaxID=1342299 RepID=UPI00046A041C|nr:type VI secretion system-associated protein TagF [Sulfitobacter geojensis]KHA53919.1 Type VI secretion-associated protein [Sulfitobacter geojensis]NYI30169.1 type VI secretion system protein ImpM [Sulfitobacter geojensis]